MDGSDQHGIISMPMAGMGKIDTEPFNEEYDVIRVLSSAYEQKG